MGSVMWLVNASEFDAGAIRATILTHPSMCTAQFLADILEGFEGVLMADGYKVPAHDQAGLRGPKEENPDAEAHPNVCAGCL